MVGLRERVEQVAELTRVKPVTAIHAARTLGEADPPLFARPGRGIRDVLFGTSDLVHLALALAGGDPGESPETVRRLGELHRDCIQRQGLASDAEWHDLEARRRQLGRGKNLTLGDMILMPTLIETIVRYVDRLRGAERAELLPGVEDTLVELRTGAGGAAGRGSVAMVSFRWAAGKVLQCGYHLSHDLDPHDDSWKTALLRTTHIRGDLLLALADLLRDDDARRASTLPFSPSGSDAASSGPENRNAALPGAALSDQHRTTDDTRILTRSKGSRDTSRIQARRGSVMQPGRSFNSERTNNVCQSEHSPR